MQLVTKKQANVRWRTDKSGVTLAVYSGPLDGESLAGLRHAVNRQAIGTAAYVVRVDQSCLLMGVNPWIPDAGMELSSIAGGCVVCRPDQLEVMRQYSQYMAERGVVRTVFLDSEIQEALHFAARHADALRRR